MYGLVNKAVEELIVSRFGEDKWNEITRRANLPKCPFVSMQPYPDEITYGLVNAAAEVLQLSTSQVLEAFGEQWVLFTAAEGYGPLLDNSGQTLQEFLHNLDNLHTRVGMIYPELKPPEFHALELPDGSIRLEYYSKRVGLAPMIQGLLKGLSKRFNISIQVREIAPEEDSSWQAAFLIRPQA
jgi:hypothetical protein